jgi:hypothetical protein
MQSYKKKWRKYSLNFLKNSFILFVISSFLTSCYKKKDTLLMVYVRDETGSVIESAKVRVFAEPTDTSNNSAMIVDFEKITDNTGTADFNFNQIYETGQTGVAVVKVKATYFNKVGQKIVELVEEQNNECYVEIK